MVIKKISRSFVHQIFEVDILAVRMLSEINHFDAKLNDKIAALKLALNFLLAEKNKQKDL
jgi:hypothetical protein